MVTNVLCAIIKSNDTIFNISQMYKHCKKSISGDIAYTIFFYDPKMAEKYTAIVESISNFHNIKNFTISTEHKSFFNKDYYLLYFLDQSDYLAICENKFIKDKFSLIFCSGSAYIDKSKSVLEPIITYVPEKSNPVCPVQSYDDKLLRYKGEESIDINMKICGKDNIVKWLPIRQRLYSKNIVYDDKIYLYQQYFIHPEETRKSEINYCLEQNIDNKYIDEILLLNEEKYKNNLLSSSKISQELIHRRIKFSDILRHAKYNLNGYIVFSNSDIFFDQTINKIKYGTLSTEKSIDTICRYEYNKGDNLLDCKLRPIPRFHSQDGWIIHTNFLKDVSDVQINKHFNFQLGIPGCDHKILAEFHNLGFNVYNNPQDIRGYHYHTSQIRNYNPTKLLPPPYAYSQPVLDTLTKHSEFMHTSGLFWQYPVITEKTFYIQNKNDPKYLPIPWATIIDKFSNQLEAVYNLIINWYDPDLNYYTCCQTIHLDKLLSLMSKVGVKTIYTPHKEINKNSVQVDETKIELLPCPLYAVNVEDITRNIEFKDVDLINRDTKYLYSFKGAWEPHYISKIRQNIFNMNHQKDTVIENIGKWHFVKDVYSNIQNKSGEIDNSQDKQNRTSEYNNLLLDSKFSLCPSGAGPNSIRFWESLAVGCIPVLLADTLELPDHKDWDKAILRVSEHNVDNLEILRDITDDEIIERRKKCIEIYNHFKYNYKNDMISSKIESSSKIIHYCCGSYDIGDFGGVARFDYQVKQVFPNRIFFKGPEQKQLLNDYLDNYPNSIVITDNHLSCDISNKYKVILVHHGIAKTHSIREPDWNPYWKNLCCSGQDKMLTYRDPCTTKIISISQFCTDEFTRHYNEEYLKFSNNKLLHTSELDINKYKTEWNRIPKILGNWKCINKGKLIIDSLIQTTNYNFQDLNVKPINSNMLDFNKRKQDIYLDSDIFLQLSLCEGNSYSTLDALLCGIPVVSTDVGLFYKDIPEDCFVKLDWTKINDISYINSKIQYAIKNKELIGRKGREWFIKNCTYDNWCNKLKDIVKKSFDKNTIIDNYDFLKVYDINNKIRIGSIHDGGYIIIDNLCEYDVLLSCGIANNDTFEHYFVNKYNKKCYAFDGTINNIPNKHQNITFIKKNIGITEDTTDMKDIIKDYDNIFIKMDIEGSEYDWINNLSDNEINKFKQICIEFHLEHECSEHISLSNKLNAIKKLANSHYCVHFHGNNWRSTTLLGRKIINIGTSATNSKIINLDKEYPSNTKVTFDYKSQFPIKFSYKFQKKQLIINRIDKNCGWNYKYKCVIDGIQIPKVFECTYIHKSLVKELALNSKPIPDLLLDTPNTGYWKPQIDGFETNRKANKVVPDINLNTYPFVNYEHNIDNIQVVNIKNPIDDSVLKWHDSEFTKNNRPDPLYQSVQKKNSFKYVLEKGGNVIDTGAHIGDYGICLAQALKNIGREDIIVYCIEPTLSKCKFMEEICILNNLKNIKIISKGLSDRVGKFSVKQYGFGGGTKVNGTNTGAWQWTPDENGIEFTTLDILYEQGIIDNIGFFWLDAQWMEPQVLKGGEKLLKRCKPYILMEYWPIYEYCEDMVSVKKSSRGNRNQLSKDNIFKTIFENYNIKISDKGHQEFDDILLEFNIKTNIDISIPKIIHQTYKNYNLPETYKMCQTEIKRLHPDFEYRFYTDEDIDKLMKTEFPEYYDKFNELPRMIMKIDMFRYFLMYKYGGMYADMDYLMFKSFDILNEKVVIPTNRDLDNNKLTNLGNCIFASVPNHPFWKSLIDTLFTIDRKNLPYEAFNNVIESTGPKFVFNMWKKYSDSKNDICIPKRELFHPITKNDNEYIEELKKKGCYGIHLCSGLWINNL